LPNTSANGQDASNWDAEAVAQGTATISYGIVAPDGTPTAAKITTVGGFQRFIIDSRSITPAVGDIVIWGGWLQNPNYATKNLETNALSLRWTNTAIHFDTSGNNIVGLNQMGWAVPSGSHNSPLAARSSPSWLPIAGIAKIAAVSGSPETLALRFVVDDTAGTNNPDVVAWQPFYYYFAAGTITVDEATRLWQSLRRGTVGGVAGDIALLDHHKLRLGGGSRLDSAAAQPVRRVYAVGDKTLDTTNVSNGWLCVQAGGAFSTTRANTTAYATGVWAAWPSGTTVVECTQSGTTAGSPPTAPTTVGQVVTDGGAKWTCRALTHAGFAQRIERQTTIQTGASYTVLPQDIGVICNHAGGSLTLTLPDPAAYQGRALYVKNLSGTGNVVSSLSNVLTIGGTVPGILILGTAIGPAAWAEIISDGTNWVTMTGN
jgi:hypothetical protein